MWLGIHERELLDKEAYTMAEVIDDAISIIRLHSPEKPVIEEQGIEFVALCPNCGHILWDKIQVCDRCTQMIDWSDEDD